MNCQKCKSAAASVCITHIVDSQKIDTYLCQDCANESAAEKLKAALGISGSIPSHMVFGAERGPQAQNKETERCKGCGTSFADIQKSGKLGCALCYDTFRARLRPIVTRIHRSAQHRGKSPDGAVLPNAAQGGQGTGGPAAGGQGANARPAGGRQRAGEAPGQKKEGPARQGTARRWEEPVRAERPIGPPSAAQVQDRLGKLKAALADAITAEEYERAAELRDLIKAVEKKMN